MLYFFDIYPYMYLAAQWMELFEHMVTLVNNVLSDLYQFCKLFDTDFCFQGYEYREKLDAIDFLECSYFRRELLPTEDISFHLNLVPSSLVTQSNQ